ncbi:MAG: 3-oxoacyl-ACP reductase FabG [Syntrophomonadaceae bacterium]|nr:3-oxoacyl-ACP reductase FabG [Syntrophomonadaceae bacterium]
MTGDKKVALVTGASRGIGREIAKQLALKGYKVGVNYYKSSEMAFALVEDIRKTGGEAIAIKADVSNSDEVESMFAILEQNFGSAHILVNNAGISSRGLVHTIDEYEWDKVMGINLKGAFLCTRRALPQMISNKVGRIINITSVWGITGASYESIYATSKGGLITFTKSLAKELGPSGITANAIAPGPIATDMLDEELSLEDKLSLIDDIALGRLGRPEDVAALCVYLVSDEASFITGQVISVDGGFIA